MKIRSLEIIFLRRENDEIRVKTVVRSLDRRHTDKNAILITRFSEVSRQSSRIREMHYASELSLWNRISLTPSTDFFPTRAHAF